MKKVYLLVLCLALCVCLAGCGGQSDDPVSNGGEAAPSSASGENGGGQSSGSAAAGYTIDLNGATIAVEADMAEITAKLGEPDDYFESASCAFEGLDKVYTYGSVEISTYPDGDKDYVLSFKLKDDLVETSEGIYIGSGRDAVIAAYGEPDEEAGTALYYIKDNCKLSFILEGDAVAAITYTSTENAE